MQQAGYHHANMLAEAMKSDMERKNDEVISILQDVLSKSTAATEIESQLSAPSAHVANATSSDAIQLQMIQLLQQTQQDMKTCLIATTNQHNNTSSPAPPTPQPKRYRKTPDNCTFFRRLTEKYCWTHGGCNHFGKDCKTKAPGHKDDATLENKMGGSKAYCKMTCRARY